MLPGLISNRNDGSRVGKSKCGNLQIAGEEKKGRKKMKERNQPKGKEAGMLRATGGEQREGGIWKVLSPFAREVKTPEIHFRNQHGFLVF